MDGYERVTQASGGYAIRHARVTTGSVALSGTAAVSVTWPQAFPDANYTVTASVVLDIAGESLRVVRVRSKTATGCVVQVVNNDAAAAHTGVVHAVAIHD